MRSNRTRRAKAQPKEPAIKVTAKQKRIAAIVAVIILVLGIGYGRTIIKLQAENKKLKAEQEELQKEKSALTKELKNIHSKEYIQEQARKQLRLLNKDEILFVFEDEESDDK